MTVPSDSRPPSERSDAPGSLRANPAPWTTGYPAVDSPTVRSGPGVGMAATAAGSSAARVDLVGGPASVVVAAPTALGLPIAGDRIDMFLIQEAIGAGGMGAVFRASDTRLDRDVALKILPPEQANDAEVVQRFYQEGRAAARLDHENIARVFTIGHDARYHYIAFEYIEGITIRQRVERNGPMSAGEAINYTLQIADALVHAAERGVVHRDIKPSNIIVTPHGRAKLVDMGLARRFERGGDDGLTQSGMTLGTFDYISPEQARDPRDVDVRSDLYSLGCTLFHMLTGRPPFPQGTVLQKLIQHQEELPPDVRALNPTAPPDLAVILVKLMAKDRDRRYQTPEQLVRDLLIVAGAMGLRSVSPEGLVWLSTASAPVWQRHLVWGVPAMVLAAIVSGLVWWGQEASPGGTSDVVPKVTVNLPTAPPRPGSPSASVRDPATTAEPGPSGDRVAADAGVARSSRPIAVESTDDLLAAVASAPPRSILLLTDEGPYLLGIGRDGRPAPARLEGRDLTIRAAPGVHPVLRLAPDPVVGGKPRAALLNFQGGSVTLDGLEFILEPGDRPEPLSAVSAEDVELTVRRCLFRRPGAAPGQGLDSSSPKVAAVSLRSTSARRDGDRPPAVLVDRCHVDAGQVGVRAVGPVDVLLRDCTIAASEPAVWLDNARAAAPVAGDVRLRHVSVLAGEGPVFRFDGAETRVRIDDSVVAAAGEGETTLVAVDQPEALGWRGRGNVYARVGTYLLPTTADVVGRETIRDPLRWKESGDGPRETDSVFETQSVWDDPDPSQLLAQEPRNPARAFRLAATHLGASDVGARRDAFGAVVAPVLLAAHAPPAPPAALVAPVRKPDVSPAPSAPEPRHVEPKPPRPAAAAVPDRVVRPPDVPPAAPAEETRPEAVPPAARTDELPPMALMPPTGDAAAGTGRDKDKDQDNEMPVEPAPVEPPGPIAPAPSRVEHAVLHTVDQLLNALAAPGGQGRPLRVAASADWELPSTIVRATGSLRIQAEAGPTRPRLRFLPAPGDQKGANALTAMIELRSGSLQLDGFDVILPGDNAPRQGRWAAFAVWPATDLSLTNCTATVEGDQVVSAVVAVESGDRPAEDGVNPADSSASTVRFNDSLFRAGGDLVNVGAGRRVVLELDNAVAATGGALVHAHGVARGQTAERLSLTLRQVTARMAGGLVHLESTAGEPDLPVADVNARYSILTTAPKDAPLIRVDGQDVPETMRDRIVWEGQGVGYHQIGTYRRDQSAQVGAVPTNYNRADWTVAVGSREQMPIHGDLKFRRDWSPDRSAWTLDRDDVRLARDSLARASGSDLDRIPEPPADD